MKKFAVVVNEKCPIPTQINAAGHLCLGAGTLFGHEDAKMRTFRDKDDSFVSVLTDYPLIILSARNGDQLRSAHQMAISADLHCSIFVECMRTADSDEQEANIRSTSISDHDYIAILFFGTSDELKPLTRKFSLLREKFSNGG
jgi:hypothetical protein